MRFQKELTHTSEGSLFKKNFFRKISFEGFSPKRKKRPEMRVFSLYKNVTKRVINPNGQTLRQDSRLVIKILFWTNFR